MEEQGGLLELRGRTSHPPMWVLGGWAWGDSVSRDVAGRWPGSLERENEAEKMRTGVNEVQILGITFVTFIIPGLRITESFPLWSQLRSVYPMD